MKPTLLVLVQDMLAALEAENVAAVTDTDEAGMCVNIANRCYEDISLHRRWKHQKGITRLITSSNFNERTLASGTVAFDPYNLYYDGQRIYYVSPEEFLARTVARDSTDSTITVINNINVINNAAPTFFTSDNDLLIRFDATPDIVSGIDITKTRCITYTVPTARVSSGSATFTFPDIFFPALRQLCIARAMIELKEDMAGAGAYLKDYKNMMSRLANNAELVELREDWRGWIIPRRSYRNLMSPPRNAGNGVWV
jgi:hypothetical protein